MNGKRTAALVLSAIMLISLLAGCQSGGAVSQPVDPAPAPAAVDYANDPNWFGTDDGKPVTLNFWCGIQPEYGYQQMVDNFNAEYADKGVQVVFKKYSNDTDGNTQLETYLLTNVGVDVFIGYGSRDRLFSRGEAGMLYDYSGYLSLIGFDVAKELGENTAQQYIREDGTVWGLPTKFDNKGWIMINADAFQKAGVEIPYQGWTYAEFRDACRLLRENTGHYAICWGFGFDYASKLTYVSSVLLPGSYFTDDTMTETNLTDRVWVEGLQLIKDTFDEKWAVPFKTDLEGKKDTVKTEFLTENCAMFGIYSQLRLAMDTDTYPHDFVTAMVPFPVPDEEYAAYMDQANMSYSGDFISIASGCEHKKAACEFVRWYIEGGMNPIILAARYPLWTGNDTQEILNVLSTHARGTIDPESLTHLFDVDRSALIASYVSGHDDDVKAIIWEEWQSFLNGKTASAQAAMKKAKNRADEVIKEAGGLLE